MPIPQEGHIGLSPIIAGAVMFGKGRTQPGVLLELHDPHVIDPDDESQVIKLRNEIW